MKGFTSKVLSVLIQNWVEILNQQFLPPAISRDYLILSLAWIFSSREKLLKNGLSVRIYCYVSFKFAFLEEPQLFRKSGKSNKSIPKDLDRYMGDQIG